MENRLHHSFFGRLLARSNGAIGSDTRRDYLGLQEQIAPERRDSNISAIVEGIAGG